MNEGTWKVTQKDVVLEVTLSYQNTFWVRQKAKAHWRETVIDSWEMLEGSWEQEQEDREDINKSWRTWDEMIENPSIKFVNPRQAFWETTEGKWKGKRIEREIALEMIQEAWRGSWKG